jgi:hypothetical protein
LTVVLFQYRNAEFFFVTIFIPGVVVCLSYEPLFVSLPLRFL